MDEHAQNARIIWADIQELAKGYEEDPSLIAWVSRLKPISMDGQTFTAAAQLKWTEQKIMTTYRQAIENFIYTVTLEHIALNVIVDPSLFEDEETQVLDASSQKKSSATANDAVASDPVSAEPAFLAPAVDMAANEEPAQDFVKKAEGGQVGTFPAGGAVGEDGISAQRPAVPEGTRGQQADLDMSDGTPGDDESAEESAAGSSSVPVLTEEEARELEDLAKRASAASIPNSNFTFDTFVVGEANRMAFDVARGVAEGDNTIGNPIFFYSKPGMGKTHLLLAIDNYIRMYRNNETRVIYTAADGFSEEFVEDIHNKGLRGRDVMRKYRNCDVLLIDDVQTLSNKQDTVITFFNIFNELTRQGKKIVLTADEPPDYLQLDERVRSRFGSGVVLSIGQPSQELKLNILQDAYRRKKAQEASFSGVELTTKQLEWIARYSSNSIRETLGLLTTLMVRARVSPGVELTEESIRDIHDELYKEQKVEMETIVRVVSLHYKVTEREMRGPGRAKRVNEARQVSMWLARQMIDGTYQQIASFFGRDHSTAMSSISKIDKMRQEDHEFMSLLDKLEKTIRER